MDAGGPKTDRKTTCSGCNVNYDHQYILKLFDSYVKGDPTSIWQPNRWVSPTFDKPSYVFKDWAKCDEREKNSDEKMKCQKDEDENFKEFQQSWSGNAVRLVERL
jgi:hypothetical protein